jgi:SpoVK/Ycf46/Vps4 family AAA+-type ATPase
VQKKYLIRTYYCWDFVDGYQGNLNDVGFATKNPLEALELISKVTPNIAAIFVLKDYDNFLKDFTIVRRLKNLSRSLKTQTKNIVIVSSVVNIPESLKEFVTLIEFPLPTYVEILEELNRLLFSLQHEIKISTLRNIATASQGLSLERIRRVLSKIIAKNGEIDDSSSNLILQEKKLVIQESQILEFCSKTKNILDLGGLDNFKDWVKLRYKAFSQDASLYGLPYPKGLLLVGVQGTGKSLAAGIIAHE